MKEILMVVVAGIAGMGTFGFIAKKYGSECMP